MERPRDKGSRGGPPWGRRARASRPAHGTEWPDAPEPAAAPGDADGADGTPAPGDGVTVLTLSPVGNDRVRVALADGRRLRIDLLDAARLGLAAGAALEPLRATELLALGETTALRDAALRLLGRREHSRRELARKLAARHAGTALEPVLDALEAQGLLDDARYARALVRHRLSSGGHGPRRVYQELLAQGVGADLAAEAVDARGRAHEWLSAARRRVDAARRRGEALDDDHTRRRLQDGLYRRGFTSELIAQALVDTDET